MKQQRLRNLPGYVSDRKRERAACISARGRYCVTTATCRVGTKLFQLSGNDPLVDTTAPCLHLPNKRLQSA